MSEAKDLLSFHLGECMFFAELEFRTAGTVILSEVAVPSKLSMKFAGKKEGS
jgi:hypothetical protein